MHIPEKMTAMVLTGHGGLDKLEYHENWSTPTPTNDQVLVEVLACGCNNTDINTRVGWYSKKVQGATSGDEQALLGDTLGTWGSNEIPFPRIQGADVCGRVVACGDAVPTADKARLMNKRVIIDPWQRDWQQPENRDAMRYIGSEYNGGFAQYLVVDYLQAYPVESALSDVELASFSTSYVTAENMLFRAKVQADDWVLVTGASGGVGSALIQLCKRRGAKVVAVCAAEKHQEMRELKADALITREDCNENLDTVLAGLIGRNRVDVVADGVGGDQWMHLIDVLDRTGRYTCCGAIAGPIVQLDLRTFYLNDLTFVGATTTAKHIFSDLVRYIEQGEIRPLVAATYPLKQLHEAQNAFLEKKHIGNIVITVGAHED